MCCQMGWIGCAILQVTQKAIVRSQFLSYFFKTLLICMTEKEILEEEKMKNTLAEKRCLVCTNKIYPEGAIVISKWRFWCGIPPNLCQMCWVPACFWWIEQKQKEWFLSRLDVSFFFCLLHRSFHNQCVALNFEIVYLLFCFLRCQRRNTSW